MPREQLGSPNPEECYYTYQYRPMVHCSQMRKTQGHAVHGIQGSIPPCARPPAEGPCPAPQATRQLPIWLVG